MHPGPQRQSQAVAIQCRPRRLAYAAEKIDGVRPPSWLRHPLSPLKANCAVAALRSPAKSLTFSGLNGTYH